MFCKNCGKEINNRAVICPHCGVAQEQLSTFEDSGSFGWGILGFCLPVVGLILYLVWKDSKPKTSKKAGIGALVSVILAVLLYIFVFVLGLSMARYGHY